MSKHRSPRRQRAEQKQSDINTRIEIALANRASQLDLSYLDLDELPESLTQLTYINDLDVSYNRITKLPEWLTQFTNLRYLTVSNNNLTELPYWLTELTRLGFLDVDDNPLAAVPEWLGQLTELFLLSISGLKLNKLPKSIGQLEHLRSLFASSNELTELPEYLRYLTKLRTLYIWRNQLTELPEWLGQLTRLEKLDVHNNQLTKLPESIGQLRQLKELSIANNQITELPETLSQLEMVEILNLTDNKLLRLPDYLQNLNSLKELYLHGNKELEIPVELLGAAWYDNKGAKPISPNEILEYYYRVRGGRRPLNEAKLILVGRGAVGKTSIVNRLVHDEFKRDEKKTEGIQITEWKLRLNGIEDVRLNIWDFGGQEIMHSTHQFFLTQRSLYVLVLNGREGREDADAEYWLRYIESFGGESPVIVVLNKTREHPFDLNRRALQQKYPIRDFIKTDCEDGTGIERLRRVIELETDRLRHLRDPFPASWFTIKDKLAALKRNYMSFEEFREICALYGEKDEVAQELLASYLHTLGVVLNYSEDPRLQDTHVLNPHWMTNGIYKVLNSKRLEMQKGEIRLNDLSDILDFDEYPSSLRRFVFDLMKKFELCFSFPDDETHYLIPELLDKQEPAEAAQINPQECLNFQYHYPALPEGLLPRFIVRTHTLSENLPRWRTGVILEFEGCRALVKADVQDKKVFISVSGPILSRRRLLAIIRSDFERIHRDFRNLQPQEIVPVPGYPDIVAPYDDLLLWEAEGRSIYSVRVSGQILDLNVHELLNGVDLDSARRRKKPIGTKQEEVRLFISYSHKDENFRNELQTHLKLMQRMEIIDTWDDRRIDPGEEWKQRINENLERADIILLLVSADFIASDYCYEKEMKRALERQDNGEARMIPIIIRDINWKIAPFAKLQALPKDGRAVTLWGNKDSAWRNVSEEIEKVAHEIRKSRYDPT